MAEFPALPLWTDAYLADTTHLTDGEHGIYLQLLIHTWRNPGCRLPNDDKWLARKLRRSVEDVEENVRPLLEEFYSTDGNWLTQKRLKKEFSRVRRNSRSQSGRAKSRWNNKNNPCRGDAQKMPDECPDDAEPHASGNASISRTISQKNPPAPNGAAPPKQPPPIPENLRRTEKPKNASKRVTRLDPGWGPSAKPFENGSELGYDRARVEFEAVKFRDQASDKGRVSKDWEAAFRNWLRNASKFAGGENGAAGGGKPSGGGQSRGSIAATLRQLQGGG